jgi:hypothetical protein
MVRSGATLLTSARPRKEFVLGSAVPLTCLNCERNDGVSYRLLRSPFAAHLLCHLLDAQLVARQRQCLSVPLLRRSKGLCSDDADVATRHELQWTLDARVESSRKEL